MADNAECSQFDHPDNGDVPIGDRNEGTENRNKKNRAIGISSANEE
jgi:hypothetical protein